MTTYNETLKSIYQCRKLMSILLLLGLTAPSVIYAEQDVFPECETSASCSRDNFCGVDGLCRPMSCENYYEFANRKFTGYNETDPDSLDCYSIPETIYPATPMSLTYGCGFTLNDDDSPPSFISQQYNRKCTAITPTSSFDCYSIDPSTSFSNFLRRAESFECSPNSNETLPFFYYQAILEWDRHGESYVGYNQVHNMTYEFDPDAAVRGTISSYFILPPTESPTVSSTVSPTNAPSIDTPISGSIGTGISLTFLALAGLAVVLRASF
mmetsp:Transcript_8233/g.9581  ORF Transcript_8233/g.9581 Transcript_8233/m.9581 type:complete len:268 (+) Transcript_8233:196-999(+)|eukprot:CAMPEP_0170845744 /NCGR_PEP_ID=MMETSP0734-20130129/7746_1 /TAXON_ID=186038 /ORGANISM="Fragilariopsis kerguelensis, Strain L26-C5" /LENGTH=267 /DNA_ID=CAMNT_0011214583 /DNA_START=164 /DNA_END=967 /DNA_ORIENTATION=+